MARSPTCVVSGRVPTGPHHLRSTFRTGDRETLLWTFVPIESERKVQFSVLTCFLDANRYPLCWTTLSYESSSRIVSRHQLVATGLCHQDLGIGGVVVDCVTQGGVLGF